MIVDTDLRHQGEFTHDELMKRIGELEKENAELNARVAGLEEQLARERREGKERVDRVREDMIDLC